MSSAIPFLRRRRKRHTFERQRAQGRLTRAVLSSGLVLTALLGVLIIGGAFAYAYITADLPSLDLLPSLFDPQKNGSLLQPTRIYDRSGTHLLMVLAPQDAPRAYVPLDPELPNHLPDVLARAAVALIDPEFWNSPGYRLDSLINPYEHPTLAQKLVSDLLLWNEPAGLRRAVRERILAAQLTSRFGRQKILEWYLNSANYGHFAYGAEAAAKLYLGKPAAQLNLAEAALLASIIQSPAINPIDAPQAALQRQAEALDLIQSRGKATADEIDQARQFKISFQPAPQQSSSAPAFTALALSQLETRFNRARVEQGGMQVLTTLDFDLQSRANCALQTQFARAAGATPQACAGAETLPALPPGQNSAQAASAAVLDPHSGQLLALIGDSKPGSTSVYLTPHRPGTLLTPFIYLTGFTRGLSPATLVWDLPPQNADPSASAQTYQGPVRLRAALANDSLVTAAQVFNQMGAGLVQQTMAPFGLDIPATNLNTLLQTENRYSVIQIARSYAVFADQGTLTGQASPDGLMPSAILEVRSMDGQLYADWSVPTSQQVVSPQLAYLTTDVLSSGPSIGSDLGRPVATKTGLTVDGTETWTVGYTPNRVVTVWMGGEALSPRPVQGLWFAIMQAASQSVSPDDWTMPSGMLHLKVCDPSGMLPTEACPNIVDEIFIDGFQPTQTDTLYQAYEVNRETGLLATVFTPEQLVEKRVYMQVPPEAQAWAKAAKLPIPPTQYDNIQPPATNPDVNISAPAMFSSPQGKLVITGSATGADFSYYRLQYGQGLNPDTWTQIGIDINKPVESGKLADWDTTGLTGLYSLQLLVVHTDHSLQTATVQISLTNP
jgi:membrane peptidoglycan carboxypeptidase